MTQLLNKLSIRDLSLKGKKVLMRVDFNVPIKDGLITDNYRILQALPSIEYAFEQKAHSVILMSHLGRPNGQIDSKYSLAPIAADLQLHLPNRRIRFLNDCIGPITEEVCQTSEEGDVILLENLRFHPEEEGKLPKDEEGKTKKANKSSIKKFRASLSKLADIYVNDAFGAAHRAHASITGINLPLKATGLLLQKELEYFAKVLESPEPPFLAIIGGAKLSDKIQLIEKMSDKVNSIILCGGMAFTFLKACKNMKIGDSLHDNNCEELARNLMEKAQEKNVKILLPIDFVTAPSAKASDHMQAAGYATDKEGIPEGMKGLDCGQESSQLFHDEILRSRTILWNGPPGVFELEEHFSKGTKTMLASMIEATEKGATTIIGGGDTATVVTKWANGGKISHVSTGGGASLELLEGKELVGVASLNVKS